MLWNNHRGVKIVIFKRFSNDVNNSLWEDDILEINDTVETKFLSSATSEGTGWPDELDQNKEDYISPLRDNTHIH